MRKLFAILLTVAMLATMSMTAFAAEGSDLNNKAEDAVSITLTGKYQAGSAAEVVSVDVAWGAMEFTYTEAGVKWDPSQHKEVADGEAKWTADGNNITVTNHSNVKITAGFTFSSSVVDGKFYNAAENGTEKNSITLERAEENSALDSQRDTVYFVVESGTISDDNNALGTITVTINKAS